MSTLDQKAQSVLTAQQQAAAMVVHTQAQADAMVLQAHQQADAMVAVELDKMLTAIDSTDDSLAEGDGYTFAEPGQPAFTLAKIDGVRKTIPLRGIITSATPPAAPP